MLSVLHYLLADKKKVRIKPVTDVLTQNINMLELDIGRRAISSINTRATEDSMTVSDFECSASDLLDLSFIVESIISRWNKFFNNEKICKIEKKKHDSFTI